MAEFGNQGACGLRQRCRRVASEQDVQNEKASCVCQGFLHAVSAVPHTLQLLTALLGQRLLCLK